MPQGSARLVECTSSIRLPSNPQKRARWVVGSTTVGGRAVFMAESAVNMQKWRAIDVCETEAGKVHGEQPYSSVGLAPPLAVCSETVLGCPPSIKLCCSRPDSVSRATADVDIIEFLRGRVRGASV